MSSAPRAFRTALVTGASRGIGEAIARRLARDGLRVGLLARTQDELTRIAASIEAEGGAADVLCADLLAIDEVRATPARATLCDGWPAMRTGVPAR